ncbi:MAG TPA: hypothetical protein ENH41_00570 [Candidatus Omnitrophica bacterium]|nr:hypothetical protein [Candidatus Omnitrophota bacterium]
MARCGITLILFSFLGLLSGLFLLLRPEYSIELQRRFYEKINWKIEPVSMPKEVRNTRAMGAFLVIIAVVISTYVVLGFK